MTDQFCMSLVGEARKVVTEVVNQGIDSRLEAFTRSTFKLENKEGVIRLECKIDPSEMQLLIRRLQESDNEQSNLLADDIITVYYGIEDI